MLFSISAFAQVNLTGTITDKTGETLPGATIFINENKTVAITDVQGVFQIKNLVARIYNIKVSFVGYQDVWQKVDLTSSGKSANINLQMTEKIINLNNVTVASTRAGAKSPFTYSTVNEEDIAKQNLGQDIPFALRWTPSTVVTSDAGAGIGYTYLRVRGTDGSRTNVTINGIPLNDAESQGVFWVNLPDFLSSTNDIQIQRGVGTSTNGVGSFGAAINLNTTQIKQEAYGELQGSAGSFNTVRGMAKFGTGLINNKFTFDGRISRINSDGYIDRAESDLESIYLSGAYLGKKSSLRLTVFSGHETTYQAWNGVPYELRNIRESEDGLDRTFNVSGTEKTGEPYDNEVDDYGQTHVQLHYNKMFNRNWNVTLAGHYTKGSGFFEQYKADEALADYNLGPVLNNDSTVAFTDTDLVRRRWLDNDYYGLTWALNYIQDDNRLQFTFGGAASQYKGDHFGRVIWAERLPENTDPRHQYYFGTGDKLDVNAFAKTSYQLTNNLTGYLDLQVRSIDYEITGTDNDLRDVTTDDNLFFFNPKFGLFYDFNSTTNLYGSFGRTSREPARGDYTDTDPINGKRPEAETLNNVELGFQKNFADAAFGVNLYYMGYENQLIPTGVLNDVGAPIRINVPNSYRAGIELMGGVNLTEKLRFDGTATFSRNRIESITEFADIFDENFEWLGAREETHEDTDIAYSPNVIVSGGLTYTFINSDVHNGAVTLLNKYVGEQFLDNTSNDNAKLDAYFISDFRINYSFKTKFIKEINLTFLVQNVFDELYENNGWVYRYYFDDAPADNNLIGVYPQATRNFMVGLGFKF